MGVDVTLKQVSQAGTGPKRRQLIDVAVVSDGADIFFRLCGASTLPMLSRVDRYGTLVLTAEDMPQFISEIDVTWNQSDGEAEREVLGRIRGVAELCASNAATEIHLEGD